jgi:hypothetical protein
VSPLTPQELEDLNVLRELKADADSLGESLDDESLAELEELESRAGK